MLLCGLKCLGLHLRGHSRCPIKHSYLCDTVYSSSADLGIPLNALLIPSNDIMEAMGATLMVTLGGSALTLPAFPETQSYVLNCFMRKQEALDTGREGCPLAWRRCHTQVAGPVGAIAEGSIWDTLEYIGMPRREEEEELPQMLPFGHVHPGCPPWPPSSIGILCHFPPATCPYP